MYIVPNSLKVPRDTRLEVAARAREKRLLLNITQAELAERTGVSLSSIKRFEKTGEISFASLLELALILGSLDEFDRIFIPPTPGSLFEKATRQRQRSRTKQRSSPL